MLGERALEAGPMTVDVSAVSRSSLRGAHERGYASGSDAPVGAGTWQFGERRRVTTLEHGATGWMPVKDVLVAPVIRGVPPMELRRPRADGRAIDLQPTGEPSLAKAVARALGARGATAGELLGGREFAGADSGAIHLGADGTGYSVILQA
jgi:hypothetical protein